MNWRVTNNPRLLVVGGWRLLQIPIEADKIQRSELIVSITLYTVYNWTS
jgi:hypothetical protein